MTQPNPDAGHHMNIMAYRDEPLYPRLVRAVEMILARGNFVAPVDVLVCMGLLAASDLDDWRRGRVPAPPNSSAFMRRPH